jgi:hypothetical protein
MANQVRIEYDPYHTQIFYNWRTDAEREWGQLTNSILTEQEVYQKSLLPLFIFVRTRFDYFIKKQFKKLYGFPDQNRRIGKIMGLRRSNTINHEFK